MLRRVFQATLDIQVLADGTLRIQIPQSTLRRAGACWKARLCGAWRRFLSLSGPERRTPQMSPQAQRGAAMRCSKARRIAFSGRRACRTCRRPEHLHGRSEGGGKCQALHPKRNESNVEQLLREWDSLKKGRVTFKFQLDGLARFSLLLFASLCFALLSFCPVGSQNMAPAVLLSEQASARLHWPCMFHKRLVDMFPRFFWIIFHSRVVSVCPVSFSPLLSRFLPGCSTRFRDRSESPWRAPWTTPSSWRRGLRYPEIVSSLWAQAALGLAEICLSLGPCDLLVLPFRSFGRDVFLLGCLGTWGPAQG